MSVAIVGYTGFVGSYLASKVDGAELYNSGNIREMSGRCFDRVYFAGLPAAKWIANRDPNADLSNLREIQGVLSTCKIDVFVLISTIDVYDKARSNQDEDGDGFTEEPYGKHRRDMESWLDGRCASVHVLRLPALFGVGLKKNALYDLLVGNRECALNPRDAFQWYDLEDLWDDLRSVVSRGIAVANLFSEPIEMCELLAACFEDAKPPIADRPASRYAFRSKHPEFYRSKTSMLRKIDKFVNFWKALEKARPRIIVSNLCWECERLALSLLRRYGINDLELAPTKYTAWNKMIEDLDRIRSFEKAGFRVYSLQSLFFGVDCNLFADSDAFVRHFETVGVVARALGVRRLVFGSPSVRNVPRHMKKTDAERAFVEAARRAAKNLPEGVILCIEPNAKEYGCNFLTTLDQTIDIVRRIDRHNVRLNFDTGNAEMAGDRFDIHRCVDWIGHVQLSAPNLATVDRSHSIAGMQRYRGRISLEASNLSPQDFERSVRTLVEFAARNG